MSLPKENKETMPYLPIVNDIAPNAPIGANFIITPIMSKRTWDVFSIKSNTIVPRPPNLCNANPNKIAMKRICKISPLANASTALLGIIFIKKSVVVPIFPGPVYATIPLVSKLAGSMFMPAPGWSTFTTTKPTIKAIVLTISKYNSASPPVLPTFFMSSMPAIPRTTVQKIMGAINILMPLIKASPNGFISVPKLG